MIFEAFVITLLGMSGVFLFLLLLMCMMNLLHLIVSKTDQEKLDQIAIAIAYAKSQE